MKSINLFFALLSCISIANATNKYSWICDEIKPSSNTPEEFKTVFDESNYGTRLTFSYSIKNPKMTVTTFGDASYSFDENDMEEVITGHFIMNYNKIIYDIYRHKIDNNTPTHWNIIFSSYNYPKGFLVLLNNCKKIID